MTDREKVRVLEINKQYMNISKLSRMIAGSRFVISQDEITLNANIRKGIQTRVIISCKEGCCSIEPFDMAVMDAIYTLNKSGYEIFTASMAGQVLCGDLSCRQTANKISRIEESIEKLSRITIWIDLTQEYNTRKKKKGGEQAEDGTELFIDQDGYVSLTSQMLNVKRTEADFEVNGKKTSAYISEGISALYRYAEYTRQIADTGAENLDTDGRYKNTEEAIIVKRYVVRRVLEIIHRNKLNSSKISFLWYDIHSKQWRGMFQTLGYVPDTSAAWRKKKARILQVVRQTLDLLKENGIISGYAEYRAYSTGNPAAPVMGFEISKAGRQGD